MFAFLICLQVLGAAGGPNSSAAQSLDELIDSAEAREVVLRTKGRIQYVALTRIESTGAPFLASLVDWEFDGEGGEKWTFRSASMDTADSQALKGVDSWTDQQWFSRWAELPIEQVAVWDGSRYLGLSNGVNEWSGTLLKRYRKIARSGLPRAGLVPGEKWLSERLRGWSHDHVHAVGSRVFWIFREQSDSKPRADIHRLETRSDLGHLVVRHVTTTMDVGRKFQQREVPVDPVAFFDPLSDEEPIMDDRVASWEEFNGMYFPSRIFLTQTFANTSTSGIIAVRPRRLLGKLSARILPAEVPQDPVRVWDDHLQDVRFLGHGTKETVANLGGRIPIDRPGGEVPARALDVGTLGIAFLLVGGAAILLIYFLRVRKDRV